MSSFHCMKPELQSRNCGTCLDVDDMEDSDVLLKFKNIEFRRKKNQLPYFSFPLFTMFVIYVIYVGKTDLFYDYSESIIFITSINLKSLSPA